MKRWSLPILAGTLLLTILAAGCDGAKQAPAAQPVELTIAAAVSLKDALTEIQASYQTQNPHVKIFLNLGASGSLQRQIEQGAPADIFIAAASRQMDELAGKNLIDKTTRFNLVENRLVLIVPHNSSLNMTGFADLAKSGVQKISIGETAVVPAGQYAQQSLQKLALWDAVKDKTVFAKDVRAVLTYVETGNVDAGIVYRTDAAASKKVKVVAEAPSGSHQPILYPAAAVAGSRQAKPAGDFIAYLRGPEAKAVFAKYGFVAGN